MSKTSKVAKVSPVEGGFRWAFANGFEKIVTVDDVPQELHEHLAMHGLKQKLSDSYANSSGNPETAVGLFQKVLDTILGGAWKSAKGDGSPRETPIGLLAQAVANVQGKDLDEVRARLERMDAATRRKVRAIQGVAIELAKIKAAWHTGTTTLEELGL